MTSNDLDRFTFVERVVHWTVGMTFVLLLVGGLAFAYPSLFWMTVFFGGGPAARALHPWIGVVFSIGLVSMFVLWVRDLTFENADWTWMRAIKYYVTHQADKVPPVGKYNGGQKAFFWLQSVLGVVFLVTGVSLWFPGSFGSSLLPVMRLAHYLAALGGGLLLIVHVYLATIAYPGTIRAMLYDTVTRGWAKLHHPLWYKEKTKA